MVNSHIQSKIFDRRVKNWEPAPCVTRRESLSITWNPQEAGDTSEWDPLRMIHTIQVQNLVRMGFYRLIHTPEVESPS